MLKQSSIYSEAQALRSACESAVPLTVLCPTVWCSRSGFGCALCLDALLAGLLRVGQQRSEQGQSVVVLHQVGALQKPPISGHARARCPGGLPVCVRGNEAAKRLRWHGVG
jgi:hypothetical protein